MITGRIPTKIKTMKFAAHGFRTRAVISGSTRDTTIAALIFMDSAGTGFLGAALGSGLNIRGMIRMPVIKRMRTRISLIPVNWSSFYFEFG